MTPSLSFTVPMSIHTSFLRNPMLRLLRTCPGRTASRAAMATIAPVHCAATLEVTESGDVHLDATQAANVLEEAAASQSQVRSLWLNRPKALHALTPSMNKRLYARLRALDVDPSVRCVVLRSTGQRGRAFCAGGDIRAMHENATNERKAEIDAFFRVEYELNAYIAALRTPLVALLDGIVMGGGVGLGGHARFRVATEHTAFAMPECSIGLHPDIGASFLLPRLRGRATGAYLALTGARVRARDALALGFATHFIESHYLEDLVRRLECVDLSTPTAIDKVLREFERPESVVYPLPSVAAVIERCFAPDTVEEIVQKLEECTRDGADDEEAGFAREALSMIGKNCPTSLKVSLESIIRGEKQTLVECLDTEFRLSVRCARSPNLVEGVRAAVIDRTRPAVWTPPKLEAVSREEVLSYFAPLEEELNIPELGLSTRSDEGNDERVVSRM